MNESTEAPHSLTASRFYRPGDENLPASAFYDHEEHVKLHAELLRKLEGSAQVREARRRRTWWRRWLLWVIDRRLAR